MGIPGFKMDIVFGLLVKGHHIGCPVDTSLSRKYSRFSDSDREQERSAEHYFFLFHSLNMPCGMPSLRRPCLPAQTMHESVDL